MLTMSDVINSLKYKHEYNQFSKRFAGLHDVKKNCFFLWRQSMCGMCGSQPVLQDNKRTLHELQQTESNDQQP